MPEAAAHTEYRSFQLDAGDAIRIQWYVFMMTLLLLVNVFGFYFTYHQHAIIQAYWKVLDANPSITAVELQDAMAPYVRESETRIDEDTGGSTLILDFARPSYLSAYLSYSDESLSIETSQLMHGGSTPMGRDAGSSSGRALLWYLGVGIGLPISSIALALAAAKQREEKKRRSWVRISKMIAVLPLLAALDSLMRFGLGI